MILNNCWPHTYGFKPLLGLMEPNHFILILCIVLSCRITLRYFLTFFVLILLLLLLVVVVVVVLVLLLVVVVVVNQMLKIVQPNV